MAEKDYTIEVEAYSKLHESSFAGEIMSKYYESWLLDVPIYHNCRYHRRTVRMILLKHVQGTPMNTIDPESLSEEERENIMFRLIEAHSDLLFAGLRHDDLEPRNVIISTKDPTTTGSELRVRIVDLARSNVLDLWLWDESNPSFEWWIQSSWSELGWLPQREEASEWMWRMWGMWGDGGREKKHIKVERDFRDPGIRGKPEVLSAWEYLRKYDEAKLKAEEERVEAGKRKDECK